MGKMSRILRPQVRRQGHQRGAIIDRSDRTQNLGLKGKKVSAQEAHPVCVEALETALDAAPSRQAVLETERLDGDAG